MPNLVKISEPERERLGRLVYDYAAAADREKGGFLTWVGKVEKFFRNEAPEKPDKNTPAIHIPFSQPRQDAITSQICTVLCRQDPILLASSEGDQEKKSLKEKGMQQLLDAADFEGQVEKASEDCGNSNKGIYKITPQLFPKDSTGSGGQLAAHAIAAPGIQINVCHCSDFGIFPAGRGGIQQSLYAGERFYRTIGEVKALIKSNYYYSRANPVGGDDPTGEDETGRYQYTRVSLGDSPPEKDSELAELRDCIVVLSVGTKPPRRYRCTLAFNTMEILLLEEYPFSLVWYFHSHYLPEGTTFWGGRSVGRNLYGPGDQYNKLHSALYRGSMMAADPPKIGPKLAEKHITLDWGDYLESDEPVQPWSPNITFRGEPIIQQILSLERVGDQIARVSQQTMGTVQRRVQTATSDRIQEQGVAVGLEKFITNFVRPFPAMAALACEFIAKHEGLFDAIQAFYGDDWKTPLECFTEMTSWSVAGNTPNATPEVKSRDAQGLYEIAQDPESGLDKYKLATVIVKNSSLSGVDGVQLTTEQLKSKQMQQMQMQAMANIQAAMATINGKTPNGTNKPSTAQSRPNQGMDGGGSGFPPDLLAAVQTISGSGPPGQAGS